MASLLPDDIALRAKIEDAFERRATLATDEIDADVRPFIDDMAAQLAACDLVLCRAGAVTVSVPLTA